ncbi:hypothetical protein K505DRAFT_322069 [Melanomma pulvis-pyrius CBS 109.77]|uniref:Large ribosomal subunit protein mL67 n=1 Tax=Melanomma pulvis-pyrius CBS 109.77 TaxID=1314802 RepID=A0A6A6XPB3_9PLEO|nr:hypothetical protein K505DRAFT_322069 [Melanomma pulvis-pyrius CBS 109.77]
MPRPPVRVRLNKVRFRPPRQRVEPRMPTITRDKGWKETMSIETHPGYSGQLANLQRKARMIAEHKSMPDTPMNVQKLANATWVKEPGQKITAEKPFTLRDLADPAGAFPEHGQLIFVFRNVQTNQILYSLSEVLDESHLRQIPFFAKHSTPPSLRRDVWTPHCVVSFPTPEQGHNAFRKLREFRKLHELCWDRTNPEWTRMNDKTKMRKIMNQRANTTADLAKVLSMQAEQGVWMQQNLEDRERQQKEFLYGKEDIQIDPENDKKKERKKKEELVKGKWPAIKEMAKLAEGAEINRLAVELKNLTWRLERIRPGKNDKLEERLKKAILSNKNRTNRLLWARRRTYAFTKAHEELEQQANSKDKRVQKLENKIQYLEEGLKRLTLPERKKEHKESIAQLEGELLIAQEEADEKARIAREKADAEDHYAAKSILPRHLTTPLPTPYVADGIEIQWADLLDGEYAKGEWPEGVEHAILPLTEQRIQTTPMRPEEFEAAVEADRARILEDWLAEFETVNNPPAQVVGQVTGKIEEKTGLRKYLSIPALKNPFKRAEA